MSMLRIRRHNYRLRNCNARVMTQCPSEKILWLRLPEAGNFMPGFPLRRQSYVS